jgi:hypothetical protein
LVSSTEKQTLSYISGSYLKFKIKKSMKRVFTFLAAALMVVAFSFTASAQYSYVVEVNEPVQASLPVVGVNIGWGTHLGPGDPLTAEAVVVADSTGSNLGCVGSAPGAYEGKIAIVRRGECGFIIKVQNAFAAGAIAVVIVNTEGTAPTDIPNAAGAISLNLPVMMIAYENGGNELVTAIEGGASAELSIVRQPIDPGDINIIWGGPGDPNSEFAGGFNDWTAVGVACGDGVDGENANWVWGEYVRGMGGFSGTQPTIASPSNYNGHVIFDSNFLDDGGVQGAFGEGPCPAPHRGELTSPVIDLSDELSVAVRFNQIYRRFGGPGSSQQVTGSYIEVTNNGGESWSSFPVNSGLAVNAQTAANDVQIVDISAVAAGREAVQIRFVFDGDYYFWQIDDVYLIGLPDNSIGITRVFSPVITKFTPQAQLGPLFEGGEGWPFAAALRNFGGNLVDNAQLRVVVQRVEGEVVFDEVQATPPLVPSPDDIAVLLDVEFDPVGLAPGEYTVTYTLFQEGIEDFDPSNNSSSFNFFVTDNSFWQSGLDRSSVSPGGLESATWGFGALIESLDPEGLEFAVTSIETYVNIISGNADEMDGQVVSVYMIEDLGIASGDEYGDNNVFAALGEYELSASDNNQIFTVELEDFDGNEIFIMKPNTSYLALVEVPNGFRIGADNQMFNYPTNLAPTSVLLFSRLHTNGAFRTTFRNWTPYVRLNLEVITSTDTPELPESYVTMFPNPASDQAYVNLNFERPMSATIAISDISGKVINYVTVNNVQEHTEIINTSALAAGTYIVHVGTKEGVTVKKLMVIK